MGVWPQHTPGDGALPMTSSYAAAKISKKRITLYAEGNHPLFEATEPVWWDFFHRWQASLRISRVYTLFALAITLLWAIPHTNRCFDYSFATCTVKASTADRDSFSLNAAVSSQPYQWDRLERLCKYVTRPPFVRTVLQSEQIVKQTNLLNKLRVRTNLLHLYSGLEDSRES
jgi:hypothetical protein